MSSEQKAIELRDTFLESSMIAISGAYTIFRNTSKTSAKKWCDEMISVLETTDRKDLVQYYKEVKTQIDNL